MCKRKLHIKQVTDQTKLDAVLNLVFFRFELHVGERGGSVVEGWTPERKVGGFETYLRRGVSFSKTLYFPKVLVIHRNRRLRPDDD